MLIDAEKLDGESFPSQALDVCIVGAGPAGITLARALAQKGWRVGLMEGGGLALSEASQDLYRGSSTGVEYPVDASRLRYLGGTSNHWTGETLPLDDRDFEALPYHPLNAWPIRRSDLDGYGERAAEILDLAPVYQPVDIFNARDDVLMPVVRRMSAPTRFGQKYQRELTRSKLIWLCINANLIDIELDDGLKSVSQLSFRAHARTQPFKIRARRYVLCCGGLENARILLNANRQMPQGLGNERDLVGRFFSEHLEISLGHAVLETIPPDGADYMPSGTSMRFHQCLSYIVTLDPLRPADSPRERSKTFRERLHRAFQAGRAADFDAEVTVAVQQSANRDSRVTLATTADRLGLPRVSLNWTLSDLDRHTIRTAALEIGRALAQHNVGRLQLAPHLDAGIDAISKEGVGQYHHMCTTRMSDSPAAGVVNRDCRLHGVENLYLGGSSVFASAGAANPTYTIVQLALRLADHLDGELR